MLAPQVVDQAQRRRLRARAHHLSRGRQQRAHLGVAVGRAADRLAVDPERDVVEEHAAVHLRHVDLALDPAGERVQRAGQVVPVHAHVEREVVARPGRDAHERDPVRAPPPRPRPPATRRRRPSRARLRRPSTASRASAARSWPGARMTASIPLARARSASPARVGLAVTRPRVDEQHRPTRRTPGARGRRSERRGCSVGGSCRARGTSEQTCRLPTWTGTARMTAKTAEEDADDGDGDERDERREPDRLQREVRVDDVVLEQANRAQPEQARAAATCTRLRQADGEHEYCAEQRPDDRDDLGHADERADEQPVVEADDVEARRTAPSRLRRPSGSGAACTHRGGGRSRR